MDTQGTEAERVDAPSLKEALKEGRFWLLLSISLLGMLGLSGFVSHLIPLARDQGMDVGEAATVASILGISSIIGRIGTGFTLDRVPGKFVSVGVFSIGAAGVLLLASEQIDPVFAAMMLGLTLGAEVDLLTYLVSRSDFRLELRDASDRCAGQSDHVRPAAAVPWNLCRRAGRGREARHRCPWMPVPWALRPGTIIRRSFPRARPWQRPLAVRPEARTAFRTSDFLQD
jgi:hypothetical protein